MNKFTGDETCPKCTAGALGRKYVADADVLVLFCKQCEYQWKARPADADVKA